MHHLSLHFPSNFGEEVTQIYYIGLKGEFTQGHRTGVVNAVYEARPMLEDHKQDARQQNFARGPQFWDSFIGENKNDELCLLQLFHTMK